MDLIQEAFLRAIGEQPASVRNTDPAGPAYRWFRVGWKAAGEAKEPAPGEVPLKRWVVEESIREGVTPSAIYNRLFRGKYPALGQRRVNGRVIFVPAHEGGEIRCRS